MFASETIEVSAPLPVTRRDAFDALMERRLDDAYRLAGVILGNATDAEDAVHDAAVSAWRSRDLLRDETRMEAWFTRIVVNVCRDRLRARGRHRIVELDADAASPARQAMSPGDASSGIALRDVIGRALAVLEPDELIVIVLRFYLDLSIDTIAERVGIPAGTVKSRLHHATQRLRAALAATGDDR
jgi:RNA polymerase sigma-70 factor, ECF subfamily